MKSKLLFLIAFFSIIVVSKAQVVVSPPRLDNKKKFKLTLNDSTRAFLKDTDGKNIHFVVEEEDGSVSTKRIEAKSQLNINPTKEISIDYQNDYKEYMKLFRAKIREQRQKEPINTDSINYYTDKLKECRKIYIDNIDSINSRTYRIVKHDLLNKEKYDPIIYLPVRNTVSNKVYYGNEDLSRIDLLKNSNILGWGGRASIYQEFANGFFGPVRIGLGSLIAINTLEKVDTSKFYSSESIRLETQRVDSINQIRNSVQRFMGGGGTFNIQGSIPLLKIKSISNYEAFRLVSLAYSRLSYDIGTFGAISQPGAVFTNTGVDNFIDVRLEENFSFFLKYSISYVIGNEEFYQNLKFKRPDQSSIKNSFLYNEIYFGFNFSQFRVFGLFPFATGGNANNLFKFSVGTTITPGK